MRAVLWMVVLAMAAWAGWWWFATQTATRGAEQWFAAQRSAGHAAGYAGLERSGFPNRIDLTFRAPYLADAAGDWGWRSEFLQTFALSYRPWHLIAAFAPEQEFTTPAGPLRLHAGRLQSSLVLVPGADLALDRFRLAGSDLRLTGVAPAEIGTLTLASQPAPDRLLAHQIGLDLRALTLDPTVAAALPAAIPAQIGQISLDGTVQLSAALDRHIATSRPAVTRIDLRAARLDWGPLQIHATGTLSPDAYGLAAGTLELRVTGARHLPALAGALGLATPAALPAWENVVNSLAPEGQPLDLALRLDQGVIRLGPMILGPAPRLR